MSWSANSNTCNTTSSTMKYGDTQNVNQPAGYSGVDATYQCLAGGGITQSNSGSAECLRDCASGNYNWTNNGNCSATTSLLVSGQSQTITDNSGNTLGNASASCYNGSISLSSTSCNTVTNGSVVNWGSNCYATYGNMIITGNPYPSSLTVTNINNGYTGSITLSATAGGGYTTSGATCYQNCDATAATGWSSGGVNCTGNGLTAGIQGNIQNRTSTNVNSGSASFTCNNGTWTPSGQSCTAPLPPASCGSANGGSFSSHPNSGLCSEGTNSFVALDSNANIYTWACTSGSSNVNCSATHINSINATIRYSGSCDNCSQPRSNGNADIRIPDNGGGDWLSGLGVNIIIENFCNSGNVCSVKFINDSNDGTLNVEEGTSYVSIGVNGYMSGNNCIPTNYTYSGKVIWENSTLNQSGEFMVSGDMTVYCGDNADNPF